MRKRTRLRGPVSTALSKLYDGQDPKLTAKSLAVGLLYTHKTKLFGPPFSPFDYAKILDIRVEYADIEAEGVFIDDPKDGIRIFLRKQEGYLSTFNLRRLNFTLAHEIGHFVIRKTLKGLVPASEFSTEDADEEFLCNIFAAELLMPSTVIREDLEKTGLDPKALVTLCDKYDVSLRSLLHCVTRLVQGEMAALLWEKDDNQYSVCWASPTSFQDLILCDTGRTTVERAFATGKQQTGADTLMLDGQRMRWLSVSHKLLGSSKVLTIIRRSFSSSYRFLPAAEPITLPGPPVTPIPTQILLPLETPRQLFATMKDDADCYEDSTKRHRRWRKKIRRGVS
jgi:hypothetical protein